MLSTIWAEVILNDQQVPVTSPASWLDNHPESIRNTYLTATNTAVGDSNIHPTTAFKNNDARENNFSGLTIQILASDSPQGTKENSIIGSSVKSPDNQQPLTRAVNGTLDSGEIPSHPSPETNVSKVVEDLSLENFEINWGKLENYNLSAMLGEGEYSEAFEAVDTRTDRKCVVKILKPVTKTRVKREIKILHDLSGGPNILTLFEVVRNEEGKQPSLVTEYINNTDHYLLYPTLDDIDVRFYMFQLLRAVEYTHERDIMHRDIKPYNVMIDHSNQKLRLIDWGLSDYFTEDSSYSTHVASRYWRAPELLVGYEWYNPSSDIWSVGCMLAALVFGREPFFRGRHSDVGQLVQIAQILGTEDLFAWLDKYEIPLPEEYSEIFGWYKKKKWASIVSWQYYRRVNDDVLDLLDRMLVYDHLERLTASEAMAHPYFDPVRDWAMSDPNAYTT